MLNLVEILLAMRILCAHGEMNGTCSPRLYILNPNNLNNPFLVNKMYVKYIIIRKQEKNNLEKGTCNLISLVNKHQSTYSVHTI